MLVRGALVPPPPDSAAPPRRTGVQGMGLRILHRGDASCARVAAMQNPCHSPPPIFLSVVARAGRRALFCTRPHSDDRERSSLIPRTVSASGGWSAVGGTASYSRCSRGWFVLSARV